jgi:thiamine pyridinylase
MKRNLALFLLFLLISPCLRADSRRRLTVSLFPWIPDAGDTNFQRLKAKVKRDFEKEKPDIELDLQISTSLDGYTVDSWPKLFGQDGPNVIEVDMLILGDLTDPTHNYIAEISYREPALLPAAQEAALIGGKVYAIPTWVCSNFVFARNKLLSRVSSAADLARFLDSQPSARLLGDFLGSFTMPPLYIKAFTDNYGYQGMPASVTGKVDPAVAYELERILARCGKDGANPCLNGSYRDQVAVAAKDFAEERAAAVLGYSELLHSILLSSHENSRPAYYAIEAPFGLSNNPLVFVDGLVVNRSNCGQDCIADAVTFAKYLNRPSTRQWICFSEDGAKGAPPRYLLPARRDFYTTPRAMTDRYYRTFYSVVRRAKALPNQGFVRVRKAIVEGLCSLFRGTIADACPTH